MKKFLVLVLALALCFGGTVFAQEASAIKIGLIAPLTGPVAVYGIAVKNAVELFTNAVNESGGIRGHKIELIAYDDKHDPTEALNAYNRLIAADEVAALIGPVTSSPTFGVAQASAADNFPGITPTATHPDVTTYGNNYFRACFEDPFQGGAMVRFSYEVLKARKAAVIYNISDAYSTGLYNSFRETAQKVGLEIVAAESYSTDEVDFSVQLSNIAGKNPDVLFIPDYYNTLYLICSQAKRAGIKAIPLGVDGADGILEIEGVDISVTDGIYFANHYFKDDPSEIVQNFCKSYEAAFGITPNSLGALGYDGAAILYNAIERAIDAGIVIGDNEKSYQAIIDNMASTKLDGVTGHITFENNNPVKDITVIKIVDGKYIFESKYR